MPHLQLRLYAPVTSLTAEGGVLRRCAVADGYLINELAVEDGGTSERPDKVVVVFDESVQGIAGSLSYEARWVDSNSGQAFPGTLRLTLPLTEPTRSFVLDHRFNERPLILAVNVESHCDGRRIVTHIGPDDDGEYVWESTVAAELQATVHWLTPDREFQREPPVVAEPPALQPWQAEAVHSFTANLQASLSAITEVRQEIRALRFVVAVIAAGLLIYAATKAI